MVVVSLRRAWHWTQSLLPPPQPAMGSVTTAAGNQWGEARATAVPFSDKQAAPVIIHCSASRGSLAAFWTKMRRREEGGGVHITFTLRCRIK